MSIYENSPSTCPRRGIEESPPLHPGEFLLERVLPHMGVTLHEAAADLRVEPAELEAVAAGRSGIGAELATRLAKWCGNEPELWLVLQQSFDLHRARRALGTDLCRIPTRRGGTSTTFATIGNA